jgi:hypothetical protein
LEGHSDVDGGIASVMAGCAGAGSGVIAIGFGVGFGLAFFFLGLAFFAALLAFFFALRFLGKQSHRAYCRSQIGNKACMKLA